MKSINRDRILENATPEQKNLLTDLIVTYQNNYRDLVTVEMEFKHERKEIQKRLEAVMAEIIQILEDIETGQAGLFSGEPGGE